MLYTPGIDQWEICSRANQSLKSFPCMHHYCGTVWYKSCSVMDVWRMPSHSSSLLLGEGSSSLKDQSHCLNLMKNLKGNPWWSWSLNGGVYGGLRVFDIAWLLFAVFPVQHGGSCWSGTGPSLWGGMSDVCRRCGECGMGCDYTGWGHSMSDDGASSNQKAAWAAVVARWEAWGMPPETAAFVMVGMEVGLSPIKMSLMPGTIIVGV